MKYLLALFISTLFIISCGPSKEDVEKELQREDSLMEPERDSAIENANDFIFGTDSLNEDSVSIDSLN
jgi:hypothetical protein